MGVQRAASFGISAASLIMMDHRKTRAAMLSVLSNSVLVIAKLVVGVLSGSVSVMSEAIHSGVDLLAALIALVAVTKSSKPPDDEHPFGHGKLENISAAVEALLIFVAAGWIIYEAIGKLINAEPLEMPSLALGVMALSALVNVAISQMLFKVGRETDSMALQADAWHLRTDVYTSLGVVAALGIIWIVRSVAPEADVSWIDPVAAIAVALLIVKAAYDLTIKAAHDLMDSKLPAEELAWIKSFISESRAHPSQSGASEGSGAISVVRGIHDLRTRKAGASRFVEFHIVVSSDLTVKAAHEATRMLSQGIKREYPGTAVTIHVDPCEVDCPERCVSDCLLSDQEREALRRSTG